MSKRKLTWFVDEKMVDGWDDPRFPTVRGILRRGMTIDALKQFIIAQGSSRSVVFMEWDKIWSMNKKVIDPVAPRFTVIDMKYNVAVNIAGVTEEAVRADKHPKEPSVGQKTVWRGPTVLVDGEDAETMKEGENVTFINWGNITIKKVNKGSGGRVTSIDATPDLENRDYKKTLKVTWLAKTPKSDFIPTTCVYYDHIITKPVLEKDDDFKNFIGTDTKSEVEVLGDPELASLKKGDIIQLQRRGFFIVDRAYKPPSPNTCKPTHIALIAIPDGTPGSYGPPGRAKTSQAAAAGAKPAKGGNKKGGGIKKEAAAAPAPAKETPASKPTGILSDAVAINAAIANQGDLVRKMKGEKASKEDIGAAVKVLIELKAKYKDAAGEDWKPGCTPPAAVASSPAKETPASKPTGILGDAVAINAAIVNQGDLVRKMKGEKASKEDIGAAVKVLIELKAKYKDAAGEDWKPGCTPPAAAAPAPAKETPAAKPTGILGDAVAINAAIANQGDLVRKMKGEKASKEDIGAAVKVLIELKAKYKDAAGEDWKPGCTPPSPGGNVSANEDGDSLNEQICAKGDDVRKLKSAKAEKHLVDAEVKALLELKAKYKEKTGSDWKPGKGGDRTQKSKSPAKPAAAAPKEERADPPSELEKDLNDRITAQGEIVRKLKGDKADKADIDANVQILLGLKAKYKEKTGKDWKPSGNSSGGGGGSGSGGGGGKKKDKQAKPQQQKQQPKKEEKKAEGAQKQTRLGMDAKKEENLADWYSQVIVKAEMLEYYDVSGCYILRPWSYNIWETVQRFFDAEIKKLGVSNCYFPIFVSQAALEREKDHIADFAPEVAWVTKSGSSDLAEPIAIRPTSETVMYPAYAKWIQSYRDLPIKLNQWNNVVVSKQRL